MTMRELYSFREKGNVIVEVREGGGREEGLNSSQ